MNTGSEPRDGQEKLEKVFDTFCDAWLEGQRPDLHQYCQQYPLFKEELLFRIEEFVSTLRCLEKAKGTSAPTSSQSRRDASPAEEMVEGKSLGDFQLLHEIGRGGMGVVYEARQSSLDRTVAIKFLPALLTLRPETVARFKREASTAAKLKHPGMVRVFAIGEEEGNHFFAMELIKGAPLDKVIHRLAFDETAPRSGKTVGHAVRNCVHRERDHATDGEDGTTGKESALPDCWNKTYLEVVCRICIQIADALDYAHGAGVIHRDIKPSNILVREDGSCVLTDFGLARMEGMPSLTVTGELAGTPHYIAPEQASPQPKALNHQVDIYSLGVTLYEMLTLIRPFDGRTSQEVLGKIVSREPSTPRDTNPLISKDLETICLTAMDKDPARRYTSAKDFRDDLVRFLEYRPITARPVGFYTRTYRLVRRNPGYSAFFCLLFLVLVGGPLFFGIQQKLSNLRIREERDAKNAAFIEMREERNEKEAALKLAEQESNTSKQVSDYLVEIFSGANPFITSGKEITAYELLQQGAAKIENELSDQPLIQARLRRALGNAYQSLGSYDEAETHFIKAVDTYRRLLGDGHVSTLTCILDLGEFYRGHYRLKEAARLLPEALENARSAHDEESELVLALKYQVGMLHDWEKKYESAEEIYLQVLDGFQRLWGDDDARTIEVMHSLGNMYNHMGRPEEAESYLIESLEKSARTLSEDDGATVLIRYSLGVFYLSHDRHREAEPHLLQALEWFRSTLGDDHFYTYDAMGSVAMLYSRMGRSGDAELLYRQSLAGLYRTLGDHHPITLEAAYNLSFFYTTQGRFDEAEPVLVEAFENWQTAAGGQDQDGFMVLGSFDGHESSSHETDPPVVKTLHRPVDKNAEYNRWSFRIIEQLADLYAGQERLEEAEAVLESALEFYPDDHPSTAFILEDLGNILWKRGSLRKAESHLLKALEIRRRTSKDDDCGLYHLEDALGGLYRDMDSPEESEFFLLDALNGLRRTHGDQHYNTIMCMDTLSGLYMENDRLAEAESLAREVIEGAAEGSLEYFRGSLRLWRILEKTVSGQTAESAKHEGEADLSRPRILTSSHPHVLLVTTADYEIARRLLAEAAEAYDQMRRLVKVEPELTEHAITLYLCSNDDEYNGFRNVIVDGHSSNLEIVYASESREGGPFSVTYSTGKEEPRMRFTEGRVRHAVAEQYLARINENGEIPAWFVKGQASKVEWNYIPEFIKESVQSNLIPSDGFMALDRFFETFEYTENEIHMAGLICAYLDCDDASLNVKTAFEKCLPAIHDEEKVSESFEALEDALIEDEETLRALME